MELHWINSDKGVLLVLSFSLTGLVIFYSPLCVGPNSREVVMVSAAHCNFVCKVGLSLTRSSSACHVGPLALETLITFEQF